MQALAEKADSMRGQLQGSRSALLQEQAVNKEHCRRVQVCCSSCSPWLRIEARPRCQYVYMIHWDCADLTLFTQGLADHMLWLQQSYMVSS